MALITLVSPFATFRGRDSVVGGGVLFPRGLRSIRRTFVQPANPNTTFQQTVRSALTQASQGFSSLADGDLAGWESLSAALPRTDANGNSFNLQPKAWYVSVNTFRILDLQAITDVAPAATTEAAITSFDSVTRVGGPPEDQSNLIFSHANSGALFLIEATAVLPGTRRQPRDTDFRAWADTFAAIIIPDTASPQTYGQPDASSRFIYAVGDRVGFRITSLSSGYVLGQRFSGVLTVV